MKQLVTLLLLFATIYSGATIRTVSNTPSTIAQYNTIQAAIDASNNGDTVYVHGSPNQYAAFTVSGKQVTVIGPGWSPNKNLPLTAVVNGVNLSTGSSGTEVQGLVIVSTLFVTTGGGINNIRLIRNQIINNQLAFSCCSGGTYSGWLFEGNLFDNAQISARPEATYQNFIFQNNYFYESGIIYDGNVTGFYNSINVLFNHNLWFGPSSSTRNAFSSSSGNGCRFLTITNNIFVRRDAANQNSSSTFNNNITFNAGANSPWTSNGNVDAGGNISNQDPQMADQTSVNNGVDNPLLNFTIAAGPANNTGSDGKDIGLLYDVIGSLNWTTSRSSRLPYIYSMNITNPTIAAGGTLNVQVEARKNN